MATKYRYVIDKIDGSYVLKETASQNYIYNFKCFDDAAVHCIDRNTRDVGFNGWTPAFIAKKTSFSKNYNKNKKSKNCNV